MCVCVCACVCVCVCVYECVHINLKNKKNIYINKKVSVIILSADISGLTVVKKKHDEW